MELEPPANLELRIVIAGVELANFYLERLGENRLGDPWLDPVLNTSPAMFLGDEPSPFRLLRRCSGYQIA
jgi:hypothetical protein